MNTHPTTIVIVGITGDLARRKLLPTLGALIERDALPQPFRILGVTRQSGVDIEPLLKHVKNPDTLREYIELVSMALDDASAYTALAARLTSDTLFYLSLPPAASSTVIGHLGGSGLAHAPGTKLLLEKPFGSDRASAEAFITHIGQHFKREQVYAVDHYLAKVRVQDFIKQRRDDQLLQAVWNSDHIERIDILASESIGVEGRATFYEQTGALRDVIQSHLLALAALALMPLPSGHDERHLPEARLAALQALQALPEHAIRGQYDGYPAEAGNLDSTVETFASLTLASSDPAWAGVPITLTTGKALAQKRTEIRLTYRSDKAPASGPTLTFSLDDRAGDPDAYERIFTEALAGKQELFVSNAEILESWRIVDPVRSAWDKSEAPPIIYLKGTVVEEVETLRDRPSD